MSKATTSRVNVDGLLSDKFEKSLLWRVKTHLQFTGWLQYLPNLVLALVFLGLAALGRLVGFLPSIFVGVPLVIGSLLLLNFLFDLVTVKAGVRPSEAIPKPKLELDAFDLMRARHSCRAFQTQDLTEEHRNELVELANKYSQPEFLLGEKSIRFEYIKAPLSVWPTVGAHEFFVAIAPKAYDRMAVIDVGRSLQHVVHHATRMGVATCWVGPGADHHSIQRHLGDRLNIEKDHIICVCALGYPSKFKPLVIRMATWKMSSSRLPLSQLFFEGADFAKPLDVESESFSRFGRCYEVCQWAPSSFNSQTSRGTVVTQDRNGTKEVVRVDFGAATASRFYAPVAIGIWCANWEMGCEALGQKGSLQVLTPEERQVAAEPELPRYDLSWVVSD